MEGLKKKRQEKVDCFLDEWGSTAVHEQQHRDSFFGPWTDKSTHQSRSQDWKLKATGFVCPPPETWDPLLVEVETLVHCCLIFLYVMHSKPT